MPRLWRTAPQVQPSLAGVPPKPTAPPAMPADVPKQSGRLTGRPPAGDAKRVHRVSVSLSDSEHAEWEKSADGVKLARWAREVVNAHLLAQSDERVGLGGVGAEVAKMRQAMTRVGGNLNQIARSLNVEARGGPAVDRGAVVRDLHALRVAQDEIREHLRILTEGRESS